MKLSEHFSSKEFLCPCGCGKADVRPALIQGLEELRAAVERKYGREIPIQVTRRAGTNVRVGGFRCPWGNVMVGGAKSSQHLLGQGADIYAVGISGSELYELASAVAVFKGFGVADNWIHVDVRPALHPVKWRYGKNGKQIPW